MDVDRDMEIDRDRGTYIDMDINPAEIYADGFDTLQKFVQRGMIPRRKLVQRATLHKFCLEELCIITLQKFVKGV
jgi:hypothetical protein